ncbi:hypothetical protein D3C76_999790 [compost metagenome]
MLEQVDSRGAEQAEIFCANAKGFWQLTREVELDAHLLAGLRRPQLFQAGNAEEVEALREHEVFLQDPVAIEHVPRVGQQGLLRAETRERDAVGR